MRSGTVAENRVPIQAAAQPYMPPGFSVARRDQGKKPVEIAREIFPDAGDDDLDNLLWNRTGFPFWWPSKYKNVGAAIRGQLREYKRAYDRLRPGESLCDLCNKKAVSGLSWCRRHGWELDRLPE